ncbi:alpha/beta hydrolase-fold protein [Clostridium sp. HBUAS56017]|uniref:alpha/beta hydrolase n=1 Tax=Clostridium sp. HBUAS56017 TaxID=2571128 RepID=UPI001177AFEB|nr:alpha/beta hydrolase-fold protein [Clostridium sp. HBUAS56017]
MRGLILEKVVLDREVFIYLPEGYKTNDKKYPVIYVLDGDKFKKIFNELIDYIEDEFLKRSLEEHIIVGITPKNRVNEYTPWFSKALDKRFQDFKGNGGEYLDFLSGYLQVYIESEFRVNKDKKDRKIMGYSLGALVSLYSIYKNDDYGEIASICASQWYENWIKFINEENMLNNDFKLIMIAGRNEGKNKITIHKYLPKLSEESYEIFKRRIGIKNVKMVWDEYDHHENVLNRYKIALEFLLSKKVLNK